MLCALRSDRCLARRTYRERDNNLDIYIFCWFDLTRVFRDPGYHKPWQKVISPGSVIGGVIDAFS